jgi:aryl-alcohol dehydrogenase-like predicted oxidoreductase
MPVLRELKIGLVPFCPLGRGFLAGKGKRAEEYSESDSRHTDPRYQSENFGTNMKTMQTVHDIADAQNVQPAQIALAWILSKGEYIVPIPGTKRRSFLEENMAAANIHLSSEQVTALDNALAPEKISGQRYADWIMKTIDR